MQATLILPLAEGPGCPMLKRGSVNAAAASAEDLRNVRRLGRVRGEWGRFIAGDETAKGSFGRSRAMNTAHATDYCNGAICRKRRLTEIVAEAVRHPKRSRVPL